MTGGFSYSWRFLTITIFILAPECDFVATMQVSRDFKEIRRKRLPIFMSGADHAFQDPMGRWIAII